jgi:hypothetical protein
MIKSTSLMFPKNHNNLVKEVIYEWDGVNGALFTMLNIPNAYVPKQHVDLIEFKSYDELIKVAEERINNEQKEIDALECDTEWEIEQWFFISFFNGLRTHETIKTPSVPINILEQDDNVLVTILAESEIEKGAKSENVFIQITNDNKSRFAGDSCSLGYYTWRVHLANAVVVSKNPIQIACKRKDFEIKYVRPCRRFF